MSSGGVVAGEISWLEAGGRLVRVREGDDPVRARESLLAAPPEIQEFAARSAPWAAEHLAQPTVKRPDPYTWRQGNDRG